MRNGKYSLNGGGGGMGNAALDNLRHVLFYRQLGTNVRSTVSAIRRQVQPGSLCLFIKRALKSERYVDPEDLLPFGSSSHSDMTLSGRNLTLQTEVYASSIATGHVSSCL